MPRRRGAPLTLTPEIQRRFVAALRRSLYVETAADIAGVPRSNIYRWMKDGRRRPTDAQGNPTPEAKFWGAVKKVLAESEAQDVARIAADRSWQSSAWRLERRFPERWGAARKDMVELQKEHAELMAHCRQLEEQLRAQTRQNASPSQEGNGASGRRNGSH